MHHVQHSLTQNTHAPCTRTFALALLTTLSPMHTCVSAGTYAYFTYRVQRNLHIAVSMDPSNELFRPRCESNPALLTRCAVQWLGAWGTHGMAHIAHTRMEVGCCWWWWCGSCGIGGRVPWWGSTPGNNLWKYIVLLLLVPLPYPAASEAAECLQGPCTI